MLPSDIDTREALRHLSVAPDSSPGGLSRRRFLQAAVLGAGGLMAGPSLGALMPGWEDYAAATPLGPTEGTLVVVLMAGGNDALNTVVPWGQPSYYTKRGSLAATAASTLSLGPGLGLHGNLKKLKLRYDAGKVAVIQGIGVQEQANFSHFESMAAWMNGWALGGPPTTGWLGRWLDGLASPNPFASVAIGSSVPLHLVGATRKALALGLYGAPFGGRADPNWDELYKAIAAYGAAPTGLGPWGDVIAKNGQQLIDTSTQASALYANPLPKTPLMDKLAMASRLINANLGARVIAVSYGDFDSHKNQPGMHPARMAELDAAVEYFFGTLHAPFQGRTAMMVFSEFGRYPNRNDSNGFDHGWAGNALVIGDRVSGGLLGTTLDTANTLSNGHIQPTMDFRSMYAGILNDWLAGDSTQILGTSISPLSLFSSGPH